MKKIKFYLFTLICIFISIILSGCGGGSSATADKAPASSALISSEPSATPTPEPADKGALITITMKDNFGIVSAIAVLAGPTDYPGGDNDLTYTAKDVIDFKNAVINSTLWKDASVDIQDNVQVTKEMIQSAVASAKNKIANDGTFIFMYSGHGTNSANTGYLVPFDGINDASKMISEDDLKGWLNGFASSVKKCVLLDSCNSGSFINKGLKSYGVKSKFIPVKGSSANYKNEKFAKSLEEGISNIYVMTASSGTEASYEDSVLQNGVFTYYMNNGLWTGSVIGPADKNADNSIGADELYEYVLKTVPICTQYSPTRANPKPQNPKSYNNCASAPAIKAGASTLYNKGAIITMSTSNNSICAVLIGVADYNTEDSDAKLNYPAKDAIDLKNSLLGGTFPIDSTVDIQNNVQVTKANVQAAVTNAKNKIAKDGLFIFFFSGMGQKFGGTAYLTPYDGYDDISKNITKNELKGWLDEFDSSIKKYILLDSSFSGGFNLDSTNTYVMTACSGAEVILESADLQNNIFSYYLQLGLGTGVLLANADLNADKKITAEELSAYIPPLVTAYAAGQHPQTYKNFSGDTIKSSRLVILNDN